MIDAFDEEGPQEWNSDLVAGNPHDQCQEIIERIREFRAKGEWLQDELEGMFIKTRRWIVLAQSFSDDTLRLKLVEFCALAQITIAAAYIHLFIEFGYPSKEDCAAASAMLAILLIGINMLYLEGREYPDFLMTEREAAFLEIDEAISMIILLHPEVLTSR